MGHPISRNDHNLCKPKSPLVLIFGLFKWGPIRPQDLSRDLLWTLWNFAKVIDNSTGLTMVECYKSAICSALFWAIFIFHRTPTNSRPWHWTLKFMEKKKICCRYYKSKVKANHCIALICMLWQWCFYPSCPCWKLHIYFHLFLFLLYLLFAIKIIETVYFALTWKTLEDIMQQQQEYCMLACYIIIVILKMSFQKQNLG